MTGRLHSQGEEKTASYAVQAYEEFYGCFLFLFARDWSKVMLRYPRPDSESEAYA